MKKMKQIVSTHRDLPLLNNIEWLNLYKALANHFPCKINFALSEQEHVEKISNELEFTSQKWKSASKTIGGKTQRDEFEIEQ